MDFRRLLTNNEPNLRGKILRWCLRLGSVPYGIVVRLRNFAYDHRWLHSTRTNLPVVSVGNLTVGGTGKSPMVAWLARWFRDQGARVAILSRGYGELDSGQNDEALELELQLPDVPHLQHWDRVASAILAEQELDMELLILDDGFQHRRLERDLELVLLDATDTPAARWLLPGGLMREPMTSLARADVVVITRTDQVPKEKMTAIRKQVKRLSPRAIVLEARHHPTKLLIFPNQTRELGELKDKEILAFCAIGNPGSFFRSLENQGAKILDHRTWLDHHGFNADDIASLTQWPKQFPAAKAMVCTMKDWVKIQQEELGGVELCALQIEMQFDEAVLMLENKLTDLLHPRKPTN